jgi:hypothetical protein
MLANIAREGAKATNKRQAEKSVSEFFKAISPELEKETFNFGATMVGGALGAGKVPQGASGDLSAYSDEELQQMLEGME